MTSTTLAATVRAELARAGKTQTELAAHLGIGQPQVSMRIRGEIDWRVSELAAVANFLNIPITSLITPATEPATEVAL
jgi:transcriptional regulator with XRE-family HTH domain